MAIVDEVADKFKKAKFFILTDYRGEQEGLNVKDFNNLRKKLRENKAEYKVVKNTLTLLAAKKAGINNLENYLKEPTAITFAFEDPILIAKAIFDFAKEKKTSKNERGLPLIKVAYLDGALIDAAKVKELAYLPSKVELLSKVVRGIQAPLSNLVNVLQANLRNLVYCLEEIRKQKVNLNN